MGKRAKLGCTCIPPCSFELAFMYVTVWSLEFRMIPRYFLLAKELPNWMTQILPLHYHSWFYSTTCFIWCTCVLVLLRDYVLTFAQTPPAIPTMSVMVLACVLRGTKLIVDYHNYGHTVLALSLGHRHMIVRLAKQWVSRWPCVAASAWSVVYLHWAALLQFTASCLLAAYRYEMMFSGFAYANLCVSEAMKKDLKRTLGIQ